MYLDTAEQLLEAVRALGLPATMDPRKLNPPGVLLVPPDLERATAGCGPWASWTLHLVAPGPNDLDASAWLLAHVGQVFEAVGGYTAEYGNLTINPDADPLPAYTITIISQPARGQTP